MATKDDIQPKSLICVESFVGSYDGEGLRQFIGRADRTVISADSPEAKLWGKFFEPVLPQTLASRADIYPSERIEQATAGPGERRP